MEVKDKNEMEGNDYVLCGQCQSSTFEQTGFCLKCQRDVLLKACEKGLELAKMLNHPDEFHIQAAIAKAK